MSSAQYHGARRVFMRSERGSASVWVMLIALLIVFLGSALVVSVEAITVRHRTQEIADLAAISAARAIGTATDPCRSAASSAADYGAQLITCEPVLAPGERSGSVRVIVGRRVVLPFAGSGFSTARARAGRLAS